jgi:hypothetical protein
MLLGSIFEKSPFQIPELKQPQIEKAVKLATTSDTDSSVNPAYIRVITGLCVNLQNCAFVISHLLQVIDDGGSHAPPVYKSLYLMIACLKSVNGHNFAQVARALIPEIETIMCLSFKSANTAYRDRVHAMADAIYRFLIFGVELPEPEQFGQSWVKVAHRIAPPPEEYGDLVPAQFKREAQSGLERKEDSDEDELSFDPRALKAKSSQEVVLLDFDDVVQVVQPRIEEALPPVPEKKEVLPKTVQDLLFVEKLRLITDICYDDTLEPC